MGPARGSRRLPAVLLAAVLVLAVIAATRSAVANTPAPPRLPPLTAAGLDARYAAVHRSTVAAERPARRTGDAGRARALTQLAAHGRRFLSFDAAGDGQAVEVLGDLADADRVAVLVPGADTTLDTYDHLGSAHASIGGGARALRAEARRLAAGTRLAVVAWYGYPAPRTLSRDVLTTTRAREGAPRLDRFLRALERIVPAAPVTLLCHSYGSVVCGTALHTMQARTAAGLGAAAVFGSPGTGVDRAADLAPGVPLWAGRATRDWIAGVPHTRLDMFGLDVGFGADPVAQSFGARPFAAGTGTHSDYLRPGGVALRDLTLIALGRGSRVTP